MYEISSPLVNKSLDRDEDRIIRWCDNRGYRFVGIGMIDKEYIYFEYEDLEGNIFPNRARRTYHRNNFILRNQKRKK
jgi:hypothetical protein